MTTKVFSSNDIGSGVRYTTMFAGTDIIVLDGISVISTDTLAIAAKNATSDLLVLGLVRGDDGIRLGELGTSASASTLTIGSSGVLSARDDALLVYSAGAQIFNEGLISAGDLALYIDVQSASGKTVLHNTGTIRSDTGIIVSNTTTQAVQVVNHGLISSDGFAFWSFGSNTDRISNRGTIEGDVDLGGGDDRFDTRRGVMDGSVIGGAGDDIFLAGGGEDSFLGGAGHDTLDFRGSAGQRVSLVDESGTGLARGDRYGEIETILGSNSGADTLVGDSNANTLRGSGGDDALHANANDDLLDGGAGKDRMSGGAGNDTFAYASPLDGGDLILGFAGTAGNDDRFQFTGSGFGDLSGPIGSRFVSRADNLAQDADDRFIFRTTDKTLWFDSNGNAAGGLTLIADLDTGTVTAADILLV